MSRKGTRKSDRTSVWINALAKATSFARGFSLKVGKTNTGIFPPVALPLLPGHIMMSNRQRSSSIIKNSAQFVKQFECAPTERTVETKGLRKRAPVHPGGDNWEGVHQEVEEGSYFLHMVDSSEDFCGKMTEYSKPGPNYERAMHPSIPIEWDWVLLARESRDFPSLYNINEFSVLDIPTSHTTYPLIKPR